MTLRQLTEHHLKFRNLKGVYNFQNAILLQKKIVVILPGIQLLLRGVFKNMRTDAATPSAFD